MADERARLPGYGAASQRVSSPQSGRGGRVFAIDGRLQAETAADRGRIGEGEGLRRTDAPMPLLDRPGKNSASSDGSG